MKEISLTEFKKLKANEIKESPCMEITADGEIIATVLVGVEGEMIATVRGLGSHIDGALGKDGTEEITAPTPKSPLQTILETVEEKRPLAQRGAVAKAIRRMLDNGISQEEIIERITYPRRGTGTEAFSGRLE